MSEPEYTTLYDLVTQEGEGWMDALIEAWFCLTESQKAQLEAAKP